MLLLCVILMWSEMDPVLLVLGREPDFPLNSYGMIAISFITYIH